jgi:hypothetical protein
MEDKIARIISAVMHPMFTITWGMIIMFNLQAYFVMILPADLKWIILALVFMNTILLPGLLIWIMVRRNIVSSFEMPLRHERTYPYLIFAVFYAATFFMLRNTGLPKIYYMFIAGAFASIILATIINFYWKISIHMIGIGGITGGFIALSLKSMMYAPSLLVILFILAGLTGFARLKSGSHTPAQIYTGYIAGLAVVGLIFLGFGF